MNRNCMIPFLDTNYGLLVNQSGPSSAATYSVVRRGDCRVPPGLKPHYLDMADALLDFVRNMNVLVRHKDVPVEIDRMMTLTTGHITAKTAGLLEEASRTYSNRTDMPATCKKDKYGWFVYLPGRCPGDMNDIVRQPEDLKLLMLYAMANGCDVLCLDADATELPFLPVYQWDEAEAPDLPRPDNW